MEQNTEKMLQQLLQEYSFEDIVKSFFVLNLWLPNVSSHTKSQYIYVALESVLDNLQPVSKIHTFQDFKNFIEKLLPLIPSFMMMEDFLPENDWGEIKYFVNDKSLKIFYGGDLENPYDFIYMFEIVHKGFKDFYQKKLNRSPMEELEFCLSVQDKIINQIHKSVQDFSELELAAFNLPSEIFWKISSDFLDSFDPESLCGEGLIDEYTKDIDKCAPVPLADIGTFQQAVHNGTNFPYFFYRNNGKYFPILPRKYFAVLFDKWGKIFEDYYEEIKSEVKGHEIKIGLQLFGFMNRRTKENDVFAFVSAIQEDMKPHKTLFTSAFQSKNKIVLVHVIPPPTSNVSQQEVLDSLVPELREAQELFSKAPTRLGLRAESQIVKFEATKSHSDSLDPLIITVVPHITTDFGILSQPNELVGEVIGLDQFLAIFDEMEDLNEFADFFDYVNSLRDSSMPTISTLLDRFGSFKDSHSVLIEGALNPDMIWLDPHWGSGFRYRSLSEFWKAFPKENFFGNPRSWTIHKQALETDTVMLKSKTFFGYTYCLTLGESHIFINSPVDSLTFEQGKIADSLMHSLEDSLTLYKDVLKHLPFVSEKEKIHVLFFPRSLVDKNPKFGHIKHLISSTGSLWEIDITRLNIRDYGIRVVFDDELIVMALKDAKDRSLQISLLQDVLSQINSVFGNDIDLVKEKLEAEKTQKNRFRMFSYEKKVSFSELSKYVIAETRELKLADKKISEICKGSGISPGKYNGTEANEKLNILKERLLAYLNQRVSDLNFKTALPIVISNIDSLTNEHEQDEAQTENSMDQHVDYQREELSGKSKQAYIHNHKNYRYLIEKLVQLQPIGNKDLTDTELSEIFALVDRMLLLYAVSDYLHYGIHPAKIEITHDFLVNVSYESGIDAKIKAGAEEQAKIRLGMIGNSSDTVSISDGTQKYVEELDQGFKTDLGFSLRDMMDVHRVLMMWAIHNEKVTESTFYKATPEEIIIVCVDKMEGVDVTTLQPILDFLTLDPSKILMIEGRAETQPDIPVWEHRKKTMRYSIRPLIKVDGYYYWGPYSVERSGRLWAGIIETSKLPSDIAAPTVTYILDKGHKSVANRLQEKINEIAKRYTPHVEVEVFPHLHGLVSEDIGDIDIFALLTEKNIILNIESKIIDQGYCNKDLKRIAEKIFGRKRSDRSFKEGYLHMVLKREKLLKQKGKELAEEYWGPLTNQPKVVSIFVTQSSYWWTKYPIIESDVNFTELELLDDLIKELLN
ncbi:MAG: hypothetical protein KZQ98_02715 [Candidatus Thiodiazotropha sp. (ex Lucinoma borealis)]|nr:hypothetical protein [Candidatus Thiodiazotropha sp. (ex Lucinoma borealis)]